MAPEPQLRPPKSPNRLSAEGRATTRSPSPASATAGATSKRHSHHSLRPQPPFHDEHWCRKHANAHSECGRHGDDWLFGGFSVTETLRWLFGRRHG